MIRKENIMKKIFLIPLMFLTFLSLTACSPTDDDLIVPETPEQPENPGNGNSDDNDPEEPTDPIPGGNGRYLVLFTSRSGNTERVANEIRDQLDCDILEVEPETAFETDYNAMLERARDELNAIQQGNFPAVKTSMEDFDSYDLVFVGYPIWYGSMATTMQSFCITIRQNWKVNASLFLRQAEVAAYHLRQGKRKHSAPIQRFSTRHYC